MVVKKLLAGAVVLASVPAHAQWAGRTIGLNAGYAYGDAKTTMSGNPGRGNPLLGGGLVAPVALANGLPPSSGSHPAGFIGGGQIGYNWQAARTVYGIEADLQGGWVKGSSNSSGGAPLPAFPNNPVFSSVQQTDRLNYLGTVRGRIGHASEKWLAYATGGLAYGQVRSEITATQTFRAAPLITARPLASPATSTSTRTGWTVGGGMEYLLSGQWSARAEYLYYDLGKTTTPVDFSSTGAAGAFFASSSNTATTRWTGSIVRLGFNYRF